MQQPRLQSVYAKTETFLPWHQAEWVDLLYDAKHFTWIDRLDGNYTRAASVWSDAAVYFAFECPYTELNIFDAAQEGTQKQRWGLWDKDVVEVFINPSAQASNRYYEFEVAPNNQWIDLAIDLDKQPFNDVEWYSGFEHTTQIDSIRRLWTCQMRIPFSCFGLDAVAPQTRWLINLYRADGPGEPGDDSKRTFLSWSGLPKQQLNFHQPDSFGVLEFV